MQWYQLVDAVTKDGLRTAVKAKVTFMADSGGHRKKAHTLPANAQQLLPALVEEDESSVQSLKVLQSVLHHGSSSAGELDAVERYLSPMKHGSGAAHTMEELDLRILHNHNTSLDSCSPMGKGHDRPLEAPSTRRKLIPVALQPSPADAAPDSHPASSSLSAHYLPTGIIDYCIVLGPGTPHTVRPTHCFVDGSLRRIVSQKVDFYGATPNTPATDPPSSGLFSTDSSSHAKYVSEDIVLWDRLPVEDCPDFELPSKIEWFACPEGSVTVLSADRPQPYSLTFMLNAGMETNDIVGLCFNFFVEVDHLSRDQAAEPQAAAPAQDSCWWTEPGLSSHSHSPRRQRVWTAVTICLLFRDSFIQPLSKCMDYAYLQCILPCVEQWEHARSGHLKAFRAGANAENRLLLPDSCLDEQKLQLLKDFPSCHLNIDRILSFLFIECPVPIPSLLSVTLQFPSDDDMDMSARLSMQHPDGLEALSVQFVTPSIERLPVCSLSIEYVLNLFGARSMVDIFCCVLTECRIVFHSADIARLHTVCEVFRTLIYPLKWTHVYLPVVPIHLLNLVEAPVPYMVGTHSDWIQFIHPDYLSDVILIDCDSGALDYSLVTSLIKLPEKEDRWLVMSLQSLTSTRVHADDASKASTAADDVDTMSMDLKIQLLFYDVLFHLLRYISECLFYLNPSCPVFNRPLFISEYTADEYHDTMVLLTATNSFHELTESLNTPNLQFFSDCIEYYADLERTVISSNGEEGRASPVTEGGGSPARPALVRQDSYTNNKPRTLTRNVSVASIIFDKIHNSSPTPHLEPAMSTNRMDPFSPGKPDTSSGSKTNVPFANRPPLTKQMSRGRSTAKAFGRTVSFLGSSAEEAMSPIKPRNLLAPTDTVITVSSPIPTEFSSRDDSISLMLPSWIFNADGHADAPCPRHVNVKQTIKTRLMQYVRISNIPSQLSHRGSMSSSLRSVHSGLASSGEMFDLKISLEDRQSEGSVAATSSSSKVFPCFSTDAEGDMTPSPSMRRTGSKHAGHPLVMTHKKSFSDESTITSAHPFITFDPVKVLQSQELAKDWTIESLAAHLALPAAGVVDQFARNSHGSAIVSTAATKPHQQRHGSLAMGRASQRSLASTASSTDTFHKFSAANSKAKVDDCIFQFLQNVMVSDVDKAVTEEAIKGTIHKALETLSNRQGLISVLKSAKNDDTRNSSRRSSAAAANVYPLNASAFEAFLCLFNEFLSICSQQKDYINGYAMLEVGGQYFRVLPFEMQQQMDEDEENDMIEFLSEKICVHPIYQVTALWKQIMLDRLPPSSLHHSNHGPPASASKSTKTTAKADLKATATDLKNEVQSLLYIMQGLGVNSARALEFIRGVASDYHLGIDEYYKLQHFAGGLWAHSEMTQGTTADSGPNSLPSASALTADEAHAPHVLSKKPSRDSIGMPQRRNTGINDIMAKQGHVDKLLLPQRSRDFNSFYDETTHTGAGNASFFWGKMDDNGNPLPEQLPVGLTANSSFRKTKAVAKGAGDKTVIRELSMTELDPSQVCIDVIEEEHLHSRSSEVLVQGWDEQNINAMFTTSSGTGNNRRTTLSQEGGTGSHYNLQERMRSENQFQEHDIKELDGLFANKAVCLRGWIVLGCQDGGLQVLDAGTQTAVCKWKHSNHAGERYRGVTALSGLDNGQFGSHHDEAVCFSGCSQGVVKAWALPTGEGNASSKLRGKQAIAVIKGHTAPITCMASQQHPQGLAMSWLLACGDSKGDITVTRGDHNEHHSISLGAGLRSLYSANTHVPFSAAPSSSSGSLLAGTDPAISALCFVSCGSVPAGNSFAHNFVNFGSEARRMSTAPRPSPTSAAMDSWWLALGTAGGGVGVIDIATGTPVFLTDGHGAKVTKILPIKPFEFITSGNDRSIKIWDIRVRGKAAVNARAFDERVLGTLTRRCGCGPVTDMAVGGQDNTLVISTTADGMVKLWDLRYDVHAPCSEIRAHKHRISSVIWSDRAAFHTASYDGTVRSWDSIHGSNLRVLPAFESEGIEEMAMSTVHAQGEGREDQDSGHAGSRTCVTTVGWSGAVKLFSYSAAATALTS